ncbi:hypothetical protein FNH05_13390 [Amycolatopsis rhizosphaerae]|uniref:DUF7340 domain-containing protein n=1 Tax=Amycolatopsis rhizosphaerae TaxID=2053003 RepID=A0A558CTM5_9PSEU|nr:hypothetical protein [Amycolatopsis rhizosphaerae]TVT52128.1 hypothetical protein FNH05_13390 [Amycolatopsis rhizosphaerae]
MTLREQLRGTLHEIIDPEIVQRLDDNGDVVGYSRLPSLLDRLEGSIRDKLSKLPGGTSGFKAKLPIHVEAFDLYRDVREAWGSAPRAALRALMNECPEWTDDEFIANQLAEARALRDSIRSVLEPSKRIHLRDGHGRAAECPMCHARMIGRTDASGERVQTPALVVDMAAGCVCLACGETWAPERFEELAAAIDGSTTQGETGEPSSGALSASLAGAGGSPGWRLPGTDG